MFGKLFGKKKPVVAAQEEIVVDNETVVEEEVIVEEPIQEEPIQEETVVEEPVDELTYYVAFYNTPNGGKARGYWKTSMKEVDEETNSFLFRTRLEYQRYQTASISHSKVAKIAEDMNLSIGDVLGSL